MAYSEPRRSLTSADVHFLSAQPGEGALRDGMLELERPAEEPVTSDVSDAESDEDEEESCEWLALELVQHLPQDKMSKLLSTMQQKEKMLHDARREKKALLETCRRLREENCRLTRLLQDQPAGAGTASFAASSQARGYPFPGGGLHISPAKNTGQAAPLEQSPARVAPRVPAIPLLREPAPLCPEATGHELVRSPEAAPEETGRELSDLSSAAAQAAAASEAEEQPVAEVMLKVHSGSAVRRVHISRFELSDVRAALQRFTAGKPVKAVIIVGDATSSRFEVQALNEKSWQLALAAARLAVVSEPSSVPMVRMRLDGRGDLSAR